MCVVHVPQDMWRMDLQGANSLTPVLQESTTARKLNTATTLPLESSPAS